MSMASVRRSFGALGGLPRLVSMPLNISMKIVVSSLVLLIYYVYNKSDKEKPPEALARRRGQLEPAFARFQPRN
jgi:hypothetical protein